MRHEFEHEGRLISYLEVCPTAPRPAGTLLLLHAFPLAAEMWIPQLKAAPSRWRVLAPDARGFGGSECGDGPLAWGNAADRPRLSIEDYARDALALLDHLRVAEAIVCGLSMGGYVAFALMRLAPRRVRGLVLADTRPDADGDTARAGRERMLETLRASGVPAVADAMIPRLLGRTSLTTRPGVVAHVRRLSHAQEPAAVGAAIIRLMTRPDSTRLLADIDCPVLVVAGKEDEIASPDVAEHMHGQLADAALALIGHAGHLSNLEQPQAFNEALDRFLATRFIQP